MKKKFKIFIDFDDTLFNTAALKKDLIKIFKESGVSRANFLSSYKDYPTVTRSGFKKYDPNQQINILHKRLGIDKSGIKKELGKLIKSSSKFVFEDSGDFIKKFGEKNVYLISFARTGFQCQKIEYSGLARKFAKVVVSDDSKAKVIGKIKRGEGKEIVFIDDRMDQIDSVKKKFPESLTILMKRREGRFKGQRTKYADFTVKNLKEAEKIILGFYGE